MRLFGLLAVALLQASAPASELTERVRVDYVLLDVLAFDKQGRPVTDLEAGDFQVIENKKRMEIDSFERSDLFVPAEEVPAELLTSGAAAAGGRSRVVVLLDFAVTDRSTEKRILDWVAEFVEAAPPSAGLAYTVYSLEDGTLAEDFTGGNGELGGILRRYVDRVGARRGAGQLSGVAGQRYQDRSRSLHTLESRFVDCRDGLVSGMLDHHEFVRCILDELTLYTGYQEDRTRYVIQELADMIRRFPPGPRPTTVLFASPGFTLTPGRAATELAEIYLDLNRQPGAGPGAGQPRSSGLPSLSRARTLEDEFRPVIDAAIRHRTVVHTFDPVNYDGSGARRASPEFAHAQRWVVSAYDAETRDLEGGLEDAADGTGGMFRAGPNAALLWDTLERSRMVYTLGYRTTAGDPERFRRIKVKCARKGVRLLYRQGYFPDRGGG